MIHSRLIAALFALCIAVTNSVAWSDNHGHQMKKPEAIAHTATVLETMDSAGYTYVRVQEENRAFWIALPQTRIEVGETISFYEQMLMENFTSRSLQRTFDRILFVEAVNKGEQLPTRAAVTPSPNDLPPIDPGSNPEPVDLDKPVGRFTILELYQQSGELTGKVIEVRGKVARMTLGIMNRDWVHIEDGTGSREQKNSKIVFRTTQSGIAVGDQVTARGILHTNKDFGYGYFYPVIVEEAVFTQ